MAAYIQKSLSSVLHMVTFLLGNSNKSQYINVVAKILERELNTRAKKYSHFELKNVVLKENKFPLLV